MSKPKVPQGPTGPSPVMAEPRGKESPREAAATNLEVALAQAWAARILLGADADYLHMPISLPPDQQEDTVRGFCRSFAFAALDEALQDIEAARKKICGPRVFGSKRKAVA
jgi:hypothetical protein